MRDWSDGGRAVVGIESANQPQHPSNVGESWPMCGGSVWGKTLGEPAAVARQTRTTVPGTVELARHTPSAGIYRPARTVDPGPCGSCGGACAVPQLI